MVRWRRGQAARREFADYLTTCDHVVAVPRSSHPTWTCGEKILQSTASASLRQRGGRVTRVGPLGFEETNHFLAASRAWRRPRLPQETPCAVPGDPQGERSM